MMHGNGWKIFLIIRDITIQKIIMGYIQMEQMTSCMAQADDFMSKS